MEGEGGEEGRDVARGVNGMLERKREDRVAVRTLLTRGRGAPLHVNVVAVDVNVIIDSHCLHLPKPQLVPDID